MAYLHDDDASVVQLVDRMVYKAIEYGASDIHAQTTETGLRIRYRIDGVLYDQPRIDKQLMHQVIARVKVLANIDSTQTRIPQDGKFTVTRPTHAIDVRVSTFPAVHGEKLVIRILDRTQTAINLEQLGLTATMLNTLQQLIQASHGLLLATGPTGSGKTTTLYAALMALNNPDKNIITLEDPVEYNIHGITQGQINVETGFTFQKGMRSLLRQDPDVVMVGEIRDQQTANIAMQAALTGHLVLSTLHTNDAVSVMMRLMDMGIEPFLINAALTGVIAQRLARKICTACRVQTEPNDQERALMTRLQLNMPTVYRGTGCGACLQLGYKGRIGIFELLPVTNGLRAFMGKQPSHQQLYDQAVADGMITLHQDGADKVRRGVITVGELGRVVL